MRETSPFFPSGKRKGRPPKPLALRMQNYTIRGADDECWEWIGTKDKDGYGRLEISGVQKLAHRLAVELSGFEVGSDLCVCHRCDNRSCVNPYHLFIGTVSENNRDRSIKGRSGKPNARFGKDEVIAIRNAYQAERNYSLVARRFDSCPQTIKNIVTRVSWKDIE